MSGRRALRAAAPALAALLLPVWAGAQSFDCAKAKRATERIICGDPALSRVDGVLGVLFKEVYAATPAGRRKAVLKDQLSWLQARETVCGMPKTGEVPANARAGKARCLLRETRERIRTLARYYRTLTGHAHRLTGPTARPATPKRPAATQTERLNDALQ